MRAERFTVCAALTVFILLAITSMIFPNVNTVLTVLAIAAFVLGGIGAAIVLIALNIPSTNRSGGRNESAHH